MEYYSDGDNEINENAYFGKKKFTQQDVPQANATGFGAPTDDFMSAGIDLNDILVKNKTSTFFFRVGNDAMQGIGIYKGDILVVDKSITARPNHVIVAVIDGDMYVRRFMRSPEGEVYLSPANPQFKMIPINEDLDIVIWGVATSNVHKLINFI